MRLHVTCAREKHSYEIGMCDQECALHAGALNNLNEIKVDVKAIWLECSELENKPHLFLLSAGVITAAGYRRCGCLYVGETGRRLRERFGEHLRSIRNNSPGFPVAHHFNSASHSLNDITICGLKRCSGDNTRRKKQEMRLIFELGTLKPNGLNINFSFIKHVHCFYLMRPHVTHTLSHTFLFHSCVSRARTSHASALSPLRPG